MKLVKSPGTSLTHSAFEQLRQDVLSGVILPDQKLKILELASRLKVSQGAVREALSRLASEGLVESEPQKGFRACPISAAELRDLTQVRIEIESLCLRRAIELGDLRWEAELMAVYHALSRTPLSSTQDNAPGPHASAPRMSQSWSQLHGRFHEALICTCDSPWLLRLRAQLFAQAERYRQLSVPMQRVARDTNAEHHAILQAAIARNQRLATALLATHLQATTDLLLTALQLAPPAGTAAGAA